MFFLFVIFISLQLLAAIAWGRIVFFREKTTITGPTGVSVIVCAHNEAAHLQSLLPLLLEQQYPDFEVVVVNDRSADATAAVLAGFPVKTLYIRQTPPGVSAKKYALTQGIAAASGPLLLLTDADCRPASAQWLAHMAAAAGGGHAIVLGLSPYARRPGLLNACIRFETFHTALTYTAAALWGQPYMGVGRNLLYEKRLFTESGGLKPVETLLSGDDDLFVNRVATATNTTVCLHAAAQTCSAPKTTWAGWLRQKRRHLSVGHRYRTRHLLLLGGLAASQVGVWGLGVFLIFSGNFPEKNLLLALFGLRCGAVWAVWIGVNRRFGGWLQAWAMPFYDAGLAVYTLLSGILAALPRRTLRW